MSRRLNREGMPLQRPGACFVMGSRPPTYLLPNRWRMMMIWSITYVATPIAVGVRVGCFTPPESRAIHLYIC